MPPVTDYETITYEEDDGIAWVTLNRPDVLNAFNQKMRDELQSVWRGMRWNDDVRVVVLTAAGERAFCTGIDREESLNPEIQQKALDEGRLVGYPTPVDLRRPGLRARAQSQRHVEAGDRRGQRHGVRRRVLPAR